MSLSNTDLVLTVVEIILLPILLYGLKILIGWIAKTHTKLLEIESQLGSISAHVKELDARLHSITKTVIKAND